MVFKGPVRPTTQKEVFRETGKSVPKFQGPVRPTTDVKTFRRTGRSISSVRDKQRADAQREADIRRQKEAKAKREAEAKRKVEEERKKREADARRQREASEKKSREQVEARRQKELQVRKKTASELLRQRAVKQRESLTKEERRIQKERLGKEIEIRVPIREKGRLERIARRTEEVKELKATKLKGKLTKKELAVVTALEFIVPTQKAVIGFKQLPKSLIGLVKNPKNIRKIPSSVKQSFIREKAETVRIFKVSKTRGIARVGGQIFSFVISGKGLQVTGKLTGRTVDKVNPLFKEVKGTKLEIKLKGKGEKSTLTIGGVKEGSLSLKEQLKLAGTTEPIAVSAIANKLVGAIKRKKLIRKPIPNEDKFKLQTKNLLKRLDEGKISNKNFVKLNKLVLRDSGKSLLERSIFADPKGILRASRLGKPQREAGLKDILKADFTLQSNKPQVLVFADVQIQKLPKNLKDIGRKLRRNKPLNKEEATRLVKFQTKKSGKFKPIGDTKFQGGIEREITLPAGEIIQRVKKLTTTRIGGQRIPIIQVKIFKPKGKLKKLIDKAKKGKLSKNQINKLEKTLKRKTGFKQDIGKIIKKRVTTEATKKRLISKRKRKAPRITKRRTPKRGRPVVRKRRVGRPIARVSRRIREKRKGRPKRKPRPTRPRPKPRPSKRPKPRPAPRVKARPKPTPRKRAKPRPRRPIRGRALPPSSRGKKRKRITRKRKRVKKGFNVFAKPIKTLAGKKAKKFIKVNKKPLSRRKAKDLRNFVADTSLSRSAKIKPTRGKPQRSKIKVPTNFAKRTRKKFRTHRTVKGKRVPLKKGSVIERRGRLLDTLQEKRGITLRRRIKQISKPKTTLKNKVIGKIAKLERRILRVDKPKVSKASKREAMLKNLKKARAVKKRKGKK